MSIYPKVSIKNSIATYLLTVVFSIYFVVTLTVTLTHMIVEFYNTKDGVLHDLELLNKIFAKAIAENLWNIDQEQLRYLCFGYGAMESECRGCHALSKSSRSPRYCDV